MSPRELLHEQWDGLRVWIEHSGLLDHVDRQSVLDAWTVHELVTHVGRSFLALTVLGPERTDPPQSLGTYIASYGASAQEIADGTVQLARSFGPDLLGGIDNCARLGLRALDALGADVVRGARGSISLDDFVLTRLIELVVHGDDLARSVPEVAPPPLTDGALDAVVEALSGAYREATGTLPSVGDRLDWIRRATGRVEDEDPALPVL